ncbi:hypothetical protein PFDG_05017 [Plasmodium falciparum Dd2]|uniref:Uncharacterized protein n=1 Tax=Plasmodium falciparum (isolate Dd2) TaxID=57267 RepID=A0A0L7M9J2_PLAF4|nr:hypothetical protein PFDG_05017 [Plasmodium falciparum Dd2]
MDTVSVISSPRIRTFEKEIYFFRMSTFEELQNLFNIKENEIKNLNTQIDTYKEEEVNIHKKYEEQMNTLHDLIVSLEKQINKINSERIVNKFFIMCSICSNRNNIGGKYNPTCTML